MKSKSGFLLLALFLTILNCHILHSQQFIQSFIETNISDGSELGLSVSDAGDVNNDGYDDFIVGAHDFAFIYYGGSSMDNTADVVFYNYNWSDVSVSSAGDVNNDGYDDVIIGAERLNFKTGQAFIFYGGSNMDIIADVTLNGESSSNYFGQSVSSAGDINNDGYDDVIVGAYNYNSGTGRAYIYYGGASMDNTSDVILNGEGTSNFFGYSVSGAGDVNNDGYDDVIAGAYQYNSNRGRAYIYLGNSSMDNTADVVLEGAANSVFGISVSHAGDVNNDGFDDVIVGANGDYSLAGAAYVFYGGDPMNTNSDLTLTGENQYDNFGIQVSNAGDVNNDGYDDVFVGSLYYNSEFGRANIYYGGNPMDNTADVTMNGTASGNFFANSISGAGDLNGDGYEDVIIGEPEYMDDLGRVFAYFGGNPMNNTADLTIIGEGSENYFGESVSDAGDLNNDGYDDVIIGAEGYNDDEGRVYIYFGDFSMDNVADVVLSGAGGTYFGYSVSGAGDINGDGYDDVIVGGSGYFDIYYGGNPMDNISDLTINGASSFGETVSDAGDVNNDGYDDVIVGANDYNSAKGSAFIYFGGNPMNNTVDVTLNGENAYDYFGQAVSGAGDLNNDGYDDVVVGAPDYSSSTGRAYVFYGGSPMNSEADIIMTGEAANNRFGFSVSGAGNVNGDAYDDVVVGARGYDSYRGKAYIYLGGSSMDNTSDITMTGENIWDNFSYSVSNAGDINHDGYDDVIVGAYGFNSSTGRVYVYYGGSTMDNNADVIIDGEKENDSFGSSVSFAGEVNGDGYDDIITGTGSYPYNGKAYIYSDDSAPLPIELISFTGKVVNNKVELNWQTATEVNNYGFEILRSAQNEFGNWIKIGFVNGCGNSNSPKRYKYIDDNPTGSNKFLYRLKQIDTDGNFDYTDIIEVDIIPTEFNLSQNYPNPFNFSTRIKFSLPTATGLHLELINLVGESIRTILAGKYEAGFFEVEVDLSDLPSGLYFYKLQSDNIVKVKKLMLLK